MLRPALLLLIATSAWLAGPLSFPGTAHGQTIVLSADMSSAAAAAGESIRRGAAIAIAEINERGGLLGQKLELVVLDHRGNPSRGADELRRELGGRIALAVLGGLHSSVAVPQIDVIQEFGVPFLIPWAAATELTENGRSPNFVFRLSVSDSFAAPFLVRSAARDGCRTIAMVAEQSAWGRSNVAAARAAGAAAFEALLYPIGTSDFTSSLRMLAESGRPCIVLVANPKEGARFVIDHSRHDSLRGQPIFSHWGITGGSFATETAEILPNTNLRFLQTFSLLRPRNEKLARQVVDRCGAMFEGCKGEGEPRVATGMAQTYDLVHLVARAAAIERSLAPARIRDGLERIPEHDGLVKTYRPPFTAERHEALAADDLFLGRFDNQGRIVPADR